LSLSAKRGSLTLPEIDRKVKLLHARQRLALSKALGSPPKVENIPRGFWKRVEDEERKELYNTMLAAALIVFSPSLGRLQRHFNVQIPPDQFTRSLQDLVRSRTDWAADRIVNTSRRRMRNYQGRVQDAECTDAYYGDVMTADLARDIWDERRDEMVVRNESVASWTAGNRAVGRIARRNGFEVQDVWVLGNCDHCSICPMLAGTTVDFWGLFSPGPPLHVGCCCGVDMVIGSKEELLDRRIIHERYTANEVYAEMDRLGFELAPLAESLRR